MPVRPPRPVLVEVAGAILIIVGATALLAGVLRLISGTAPPADGAAMALAIQFGSSVLTIVVGWLVRAGRAWLVCVGVVAVILFLDLSTIPSGSVFAPIFAVFDGIAFVALIRHRAWFDWHPPETQIS